LLTAAFQRAYADWTAAGFPIPGTRSSIALLLFASQSESDPPEAAPARRSGDRETTLGRQQQQRKATKVGARYALEELIAPARTNAGTTE
jgi:hypothetical protein